MPVGIFYTVLKMNGVAIIASALILAIKYILQRTGIPRKITIFLWLIIGFRLACPMAVSTDFSIFNLISAERNILQQTQITVRPDTISDDLSVINQRDADIEYGADFGALQTAASAVWLIGTGGILLFGIISYFRLKRRLRFSIRLRNNIYTADNIPASFVFGIIKPKIYIPDTAPTDNLQYIIAHEQAHIRRADHITKIIAYIFLAVHWFNPLSWVMFRLFSSDLEYACDESAVLKIGIESRKKYLEALMTASMISRENKLLLYSVCLSSNPTKKRVENMLRLRKYPKILGFAGMGICILAFIILGTNAVDSDKKEAVRADNSVSLLAVDSEDTADTAEAVVSVAEAAESVAAESVTAESVTAEDGARKKTSGNAQSVYTGSENYAPVKNKTKDTEFSAEQNKDASIGFEQKSSNASEVEQELKTIGAVIADNEGLVSGSNYAVKQYSFQNGCNDTIPDVTCNEDGEVSICFDLNTESIVGVTFTDSETKEVVDSFGVLASEKSAYTFSGLDSTRAYDIIVEGETKGDWKVEGQYFVY